MTITPTAKVFFTYTIIPDESANFPTKKGSEEPSKSFLVAGAGFEPATCWL